MRLYSVEMASYYHSADDDSYDVIDDVTEAPDYDAVSTLAMP